MEGPFGTVLQTTLYFFNTPMQIREKRGQECSKIGIDRRTTSMIMLSDHKRGNKTTDVKQITCYKLQCNMETPGKAVGGFMRFFLVTFINIIPYPPDNHPKSPFHCQRVDNGVIIMNIWSVMTTVYCSLSPCAGSLPLRKQ